MSAEPPQRQTLSDADVNQDQEPTRQSSPPPRRRQEPEQNGQEQNGQQAERYENEKNDGDLGPVKNPPPSRGRGHGGTGVDENEDNAPEERRDPAPPTKEKPSDEPPPVRSTGPAPRPTRDAGAMASRLRNITGKGQ